MNDFAAFTEEEQDIPVWIKHCPYCGRRHKVERNYMVHYIKCGKYAHMVGMMGKLLPEWRDA